MHYFIPISPDEKARLVEAGIHFADLTIRDETGIIIEDTRIKQAVGLLGYKIIDLNDTEYMGVKRASLKRDDGTAVETAEEGSSAGILSLGSRLKSAAQSLKEVFVPGSVTIKNWNGGEIEREFKEVAARVLFDDIKRNIIISVPHGNVVAPVLDDKFYIWIWSLCNDLQKRKDGYCPPSKMWGIQVECQDPAFRPSLLGVPIPTDNGYVAAELINGNNLYILHDICHHGRSNEIKLFERLLLEAKPVIMDWLINGKATDMKDRVRKAMQDIYIKKCARRINESVDLLKVREANLRKETGELQAELTKKVRELQNVEDSIRAAGDTTFNPEDRFRQEFEAIKNNKKIKDFYFTDTSLKIYTNTIYCMNPKTDREHEIGEFEIVVSLDGKNEDGDNIRFNNLTRKVVAWRGKEMNAPHVFPEGHACLGTLKGVFPKLIGKSEYAAIVFLAIQFLESVNVDDSAGKYIEEWPLSRRKPDERETA